jgi:hypothetical protein
MGMKLEHLRARCEQMIRDGQIQKAASQLSRMNPAKVPRALRLPLANLCRRARLNTLGLKLLWPLIGPKNALKRNSPTAHELAEYAVLLQRNGGACEAMRILRSIPEPACLEVSLYQGFIHMTEWQYPEAKVCLQKYLLNASDEYQRLIAKTNLAAVHIGLEEFADAELRVHEAMEDAHKKGSMRLVGNCLEMLAQINMHRGQLKESRSRLCQAADLFKGGSPWDLYLIRKNAAILDSMESGSDTDLQKIRREALDRGDSETLRDVDLFLLKSNFNPDLHARLVVGTPFPFFRERVKRQTGLKTEPRQYRLGDESAPSLDIRTGRLDGRDFLNPGKKIHQLLDVLTRDLYRPLRIGALFSALFPNENYDVNSSAFRIYHALRQTRIFLKKHGLPVRIEEHEGRYSLAVVGSFAIALPLERDPVDGMSAMWARLVERAGDNARFSRADVMSLLGLSESSAQRLLRWATNAGKMTVDRSQTSQRYKIIGAA